MAVVSGRAGDDVHDRVAVDGIVYVGSHGLELDRQADRWRQQIADFASAAPWPGSEIELKGLTVTFHYRHREDERAAVLELERSQRARMTKGLSPASDGSCSRFCRPLARTKAQRYCTCWTAQD